MNRTLLVAPFRVFLLGVFFALISGSLLFAQETKVWTEGTDYKLSSDGKTLTYWKVDNVDELDMNADPKLAQVENIAKSTFVFKTIKTLRIGDKVKKIEPRAFLSSYITSLTLGKETSQIDGAFYQVEKLNEVIIPLGNSAFVLDGETIYTADYQKLLWNIGVSDEKKLTINSQVKEIAHGAFWLSRKLERIECPEALERVADFGFRGAFAVRRISFGENLKSVGKNAFSGCDKLYQIDIATATVPTAGEGLFEETSKATLSAMELRVPEASIDAYRSNNEWGKVGSIVKLVKEIPSEAYELSQDGKTLIKWIMPMVPNIDMANDPVLSKVEVIGEQAFVEVGGYVENIVLPTTLKRIEKEAFYTCGNLINMPLPETIEYIGDRAFALLVGYNENKRLILPKSLKEIGEEAFLGLNASRVSIPAATEKIGDNAFSQMRKCVAIEVAEENQHFAQRYGMLMSKDLKILIHCPQNKHTGEYDLSREAFENLEEIGTGAFYGQEKLRSIRLPETLKKIGDFAFADILALTHVYLPASLEELGKQVFYKTEQLYEIHLAEGSKHFMVEDNILYSKDQTKLYQACSEHRYRNYALPSSVKEIKAGAFAYVFWLYTLTLPEGLTTIEDYAFYNSPRLSAIDIPASITKIGASAFGSSKKLEKVICRAEKVPETADNAFLYIAEDPGLSSKLYVPQESMYLYANEPAYKKFKEILPISKLANEEIDLETDYSIVNLEGGFELVGLSMGSNIQLYSLSGELLSQYEATSSSQVAFAVPVGSYVLVVNGEATKIVVR